MDYHIHIMMDEYNISKNTFLCGSHTILFAFFLKKSLVALLVQTFQILGVITPDRRGDSFRALPVSHQRSSVIQVAIVARHDSHNINILF